ncbi:MAG TPA: hypothetical protein ENL21_01735 [Caldithrix abyssi]|uniref:Uncharacterized protein n=1 Tax=Caldithrix abyssi TaxID=187145 RepID=A0A7V5LHZ3_CALAY|nr:hypothetical protein [Caldithrix abyssi]
MRLFFIIFCFLLLDLSFAQEKQIPLLPEKNIVTVKPEINQQFNLFPEYERLVSVRLFKSSDSSYVLQILFEKNNSHYQIRKPLTPASLAELRKQLLEKMRPRQMALDQQGRTKLLIASTTLSLGYYGWVLPIALEVNSGKLAVALYMFSGSSGFFIPYLLTKDRPVSNAAFHLANYGATRGIVHGMFLPLVFDHHVKGETVLLSSVATSVLEGVAGYTVATNYQLPLSTAETISVGGDFGALLGMNFAVTAGFFDDASGGSASILAGSALGLAGGWYLTTRQHYSRGDARVLESTALLGAYLPLAIVDLTNSKDSKTFAAASMAGTLLGLGYGHYLLKDKDFAYNHGLFIELSEIAAGFLAAGFAYLLTPEDSGNLHKIVLTSSAVGATIGFSLMYNNFVNKAKLKNSKISMKVNFSPLGLLRLKGANGREFTPPLFSAQIRF